MKNIYINLFLIILFTINLFPQELSFAWISDLLENSDAQQEKILSEIIQNINSRSDITFVVVDGNVTSTGSESGLETVKNILDGLKSKYYIIPGRNYIENSTVGGVKFTELFKDDKFELTVNDITLIGINAYMYGSKYGHLSPESLNWLDGILNNTQKQQKIILFMNLFPDNWAEVNNRIKGFNIASLLVPTEVPPEISGMGIAPDLKNKPLLKQATRKNSKGIKARKPKEEPPAWTYTMIKCNTDSIIFYENTPDSNSIMITGISLNGKKEISPVNISEFTNYTADIIWEKDLKASLLVPPFSANNKIYTASYKGIISCFDSTGKLLWNYDAYGNIISQPAVYNNILAAGTLQGDLVTLNSETGELIQTLGVGEPVTSPLLITEYSGDKILMTGDKPKNVVVFGTNSGKLLCFDLESLEPVWENTNATETIESKPLSTGRKILFTSHNGILYCLDAGSGVLAWGWKEKGSPAKCSPVSDGNKVFIVIDDGSLSAIDLLLGKTSWKNDRFFFTGSVCNAEGDNRLIVNGTGGKLYALSPEDGKLLKEIELISGDNLFSGNPVEYNGNILDELQSGMIYTIGKDYNFKPALFLGTAPVHTIQQANGFLIAANVDGKLVAFRIN